MFPLSPFLQALEQDGFRLTIRDYDRIAMVLATGGPNGDWTLQRLRSALRTLLARNREQQDLFERRFDAFFAAEAVDGLVLERSPDFDAIKVELEQLRGGRSGRHRGLHLQRFPKTRNGSETPLTEKKHLWLRMGFFLCIFLSFLAVTLWPDQLQEDVALPDAPAPQQNEIQASEPTADIYNLPRYVVQPRRPVIASRETSPVTGNDSWQQSALIAGILFLLCCAYAWYLYKAQKVPKDKTAH
ncbi:MAG: hypothetical protein D3916_16590, partial [Candidatus Electrothrix sp. MAN1_4]|nr:hypothetical protein [Candidatus Electrothrix sp. MAN1_4]